jgi:hypothetical protein
VSLEVRDVPVLLHRVLAADLAIIGTVAALVRIEKVEGFETTRLAGFFEVQVERALLGDPPAERILIRVLGEGPEDDPTWTTDLRPEARLFLLLSRDVAPELPENLFTPYFSSAFEVDGGDRVVFPAEVLDDESRRIMRPERGRVALDGVQELVEATRSERAERERELEELIPRNRLGRYPEVLEMPTAAVPPEGPLGPGGAPSEPGEPAGREAKPETAPEDEAEPRSRTPRRRRPRGPN